MMRFGSPGPKPSAPSSRAYRCSVDNIDWPTIDDFRKCPLCGRETWAYDGQPDYTPEQAYEVVQMEYERREKYRKFEAFYRERERKRLEEALERGVTDEDLARLLNGPDEK